MSEKKCIFLNCLTPNIVAETKIIISDASDFENIQYIHKDCFNRFRSINVKEDDTKDHGSIPSKAKCIFCGKQLPVIGKHPYCFDIGEEIPPKRFWAHMDCFEKTLKNN